jgi:hypothetical protein
MPINPLMKIANKNGPAKQTGGEMPIFGLEDCPADSDSVAPRVMFQIRRKILRKLALKFQKESYLHP